MTYVPTMILSVKRGVISIPNGTTTAALGVAAVSLNNANLRYLGARTDDGGSSTSLARIWMAAANVIYAFRQDVRGNLDINWELVEYHPSYVTRVQRNIITMNAQYTITQAIAACNPAKSLLHHLGNTTTDGSSGNFANELTRIELTNPTTISAFTGSVFYHQETSWELVEFK